MKKKTTTTILALLTLCALNANAQGPQGLQGPQGSQGPWGSQGLRLAELQQAAVAADPRFAQISLQQAQADLRLGNISAERKPSISVEGQIQFQSDVPTPPPFFPGGQPLFLPAKDTYDASLRVEQRVYDATVQPRIDVERAQLAESQARVRVALFALRQEVSDAFFAAALIDARAGALRAAITGLDARLRETQARVREGVALGADAAAVEATLLRRRQDEAELRSNRAAALARLSTLTRQAIPDDASLDLPDLQARVSQVRGSADSARARPEYEQFASARTRVSRQQDAAATQTQVRVSAFGRVGYSRPGLNIISDQFELWGLVGLQLRWKPFDWNTEGREREALSIQNQILAADEAAFTRTIERTTDADIRAVDRLTEALALDDRIVALREQIDSSTETRFRENVVTASEYLDRNAELLDARFARAAHRVELEQAAAKVLTTLGLEVR
jgi:outer membrane protein TolC